MPGKGKLNRKKKKAGDAAAAASSTAASGAASNGTSIVQHKLTAKQRTIEYQNTVIETLNDLYAAKNHRGLVDLTAEACEVAVDLLQADPSNSASIYMFLGEGHMQMKKYHAAIGLYEQAKTVFETEVRCEQLSANHDPLHRKLLGSTCCNLASCYRLAGHYKKAIVLYERASEIGEETGDKATLATTMCNFGMLYQKLGQYEKVQKLSCFDIICLCNSPYLAWILRIAAFVNEAL
jgi:tetratricopeptide (TPR) repeat protein